MVMRCLNDGSTRYQMQYSDSPLYKGFCAEKFSYYSIKECKSAITMINKHILHFY